MVTRKRLGVNFIRTLPVLFPENGLKGHSKYAARLHVGTIFVPGEYKMASHSAYSYKHFRLLISDCQPKGTGVLFN